MFFYKNDRKNRIIWVISATNGCSFHFTMFRRRFRAAFLL